MPIIEWNSEYAVGIDEIDEQHKTLLKIINELYDALLTDKENKFDFLGNIIKRLIEYAKYHFETEEKIMEKYKYPDLSKHKKEHNDFLNTVRDFNIKFLKGGPRTVLAMEILTYLRNWWKDHLLNSDMHYKSFFKKKGII